MGTSAQRPAQGVTPAPGGGGTYRFAPEPMRTFPGSGPTPSAPPNVYDQAAGAYGGALAGTQGAMGMPDIGAFANPFIQGVYDTSLSNLDRARQIAMNNVGASATAAGAFGGSRHGVAEAETNRNFADTAANLSSNLAMQGFNTALQAAQQQQGTQLAGAGQLGNLANLGFGFGQQLTGNQLQQGAQQQAIQQALIDAMRGQYGGYTGAPASGLDLFSRILGGTPYSQTQTTKENPGILGILGAGLSLL